MYHLCDKPNCEIVPCIQMHEDKHMIHFQNIQQIKVCVNTYNEKVGLFKNCDCVISFSC